MDMYRLAQHLVSQQGMSVIPISTAFKYPDRQALRRTGAERDYTYSPAEDTAAWRKYCEVRPTDQDLRSWFQAGHSLNIGIVCGQISGGLVALDFEHPGLYMMWSESLKDMPDEKLVTVVNTPNGTHVWFRMPTPPTHHDLLFLRGGAMIELLGEGCYVVVPPSAYLWGSLAVYSFAQGNYDVHTVSQDVGERFIEAARFMIDWETSNGFGLTPHSGGLNIKLPGLMSGFINLDWKQLDVLQAYLWKNNAMLELLRTLPSREPSYQDYLDDADADDDEHDYDHY